MSKLLVDDMLAMVAMRIDLTMPAVSQEKNSNPWEASIATSFGCPKSLAVTSRLCGVHVHIMAVIGFI